MFQSEPICTPTITQMEYIVTDSTTDIVGSAMSGDGTHLVMAECNGKLWLVKELDGIANTNAPESPAVTGSGNTFIYGR